MVYLKALDPEPTISLDTDWFYRRGAQAFMWFAEKPVAAVEGALSGISDKVILSFLHASARGGLRLDINVVDAIVNGVARSALASGSLMRRLQTGVLSHYAAAMIGGVLAAIAIYSVSWGG